MTVNATSYIPDQKWPEYVHIDWQNNKGEVMFSVSAPGNMPLRAQAKTIEQAERLAFEKFMKTSECEHFWSRGERRDGTAQCARCGKLAIGVLPPVVIPGEWQKPLTRVELELLASGWLRAAPQPAPPLDAKMRRQQYLRARLHGIDLPPTPEQPTTMGQLMRMEPDSYREACARAVGDWLDRGHHQLHLHDFRELLKTIKNQEENAIPIQVDFRNKSRRLN